LTCYVAELQGKAYREGMPEHDRHIPDLVSKAEAAKIIGISHQAVQQMIDNNRIPCAKVGNAWVIRRVVAERIAAERRQDS